MIEPDHPEAFCERCGGANVCWHAPNDLWNRVARRPGQRDLMICPRCFVLLLVALAVTCWRLTRRIETLESAHRLRMERWHRLVTIAVEAQNHDWTRDGARVTRMIFEHLLECERGIR